jgi:hypothetical protein
VVAGGLVQLALSLLPVVELGEVQLIGVLGLLCVRRSLESCRWRVCSVLMSSEVPKDDEKRRQSGSRDSADRDPGRQVELRQRAWPLPSVPSPRFQLELKGSIPASFECAFLAGNSFTSAK